MLAWGCDSSGSTGSLDGNGDTDIDLPAEQADEEPEEDILSEVEEEEAGEFDEELPPADLDEEPVVEDEPEEEEMAPEYEEEIEEEAEEEEPARVCTWRTEPFELFTEVATPTFRESGWEYFGEITENCQTDAFFIAGGADMRIKIRLEPRNTAGNPLRGRIMLTDIAGASGRKAPVWLYDNTSQEDSEGNPKIIDYELDLPYSGEYLLMVSGAAYQTTGRYRVYASCVGNCDRRFTRFPVVLVHGMAGFDSALGLLNYFNGVSDHLKEYGYDIHTTETAMFNNSEYRADEIEGQFMDILTQTGARKLNLLAHSQGGIDSRIFISGRDHGHEVALLAMVATPNRGVILGDMILGTVTGVSEDVIASIIDFFGNLIDGSESDIREALKQISIAKMEGEFNPAHPDDQRVTYWSWSGYTCGMLDFDCRNAHDDERVNTALSLTYNLIKNGPEDEGYGPNDGMVPVYSAQWGTYMGYVNADHADEIGQLKSGDFDHLGFYRGIVEKMHEEGF